MSWRPIKLPGYTLQSRGLKVLDPTLKQAAEVGEFLRDLEERTPFFIGEWWADAKARFGDRAYQLVDGSGFELTTLTEYARVHEKIPKGRRFLTGGISFTHYQAVAGLDPAHQRKVLAKARAENLSVSAIREEVRHVKRRPVAEGKAKLVGKYRVLVCSPDYGEITLDELAKIPVASHMQPNAALFLVHPESLRFEIAALLDAWEFEYKRAIIWDRVLHQRADAYLDERHETVLWCVRGKLPPDRLTPMFDSVATWRAEPHDGEIPEECRKMIERLYETGPYLELLAKRKARRAGWTYYGKQIGEKIA